MLAVVVGGALSSTCVGVVSVANPSLPPGGKESREGNFERVLDEIKSLFTACVG